MKPSALLAFPLCTLISTGVLAQTEASPPPAAPPPSEAAAPAAAPAEATAAPEAAATDETGAEAAPAAVAYGGRVRFGVSGGGGWFFNPGAFMIDYEARVGYQLDQMLGAYFGFQGAAGFGFGGSSSGTSVTGSVTGVSYYRFAVVGEATLADRFFVGAGPALIRGSWATASVTVGQTGGGAGANVVDGFIPAANFRLGVGWGRPKASGRRTGFTMGLDTTVAFSSGGVSIVPLLMLGFDSR